jgi:hypothetical protein
MDSLVTLPLEIKYLICKQLNYVEHSRVIKSAGVCFDNLYWLRKHKILFSAVVREIKTAIYSTGTIEFGGYIEYISTFTLGLKITQHRFQDYNENRMSTSETLLTISRKKVPNAVQSEITVAGRQIYSYELEYNNAKRAMNRTIVVTTHTEEGERITRFCIGHGLMGPLKRFVKFD